MNCEYYRTTIEEADARGDMDTPARAHLASCDACARHQAERASLRALLGGLERVEAPSDFDFKLRARMRAADEGGRKGIAARLLSPAAATALAACAVLAITAGVYFRRPAATPSAPSAVPAVARQETVTAAPAEVAAGAGAGEVEKTKAGEPAVVAGQHSSPVKVVKASGRVPQRGARAERGTAEFAERAAPVLKGDELAFATPPVAVRLPASRRAMRVMLRDERGASRAVSMRPVSFGAQEFVSHLANLRRTSNTSKEGVW